jgi:hypothetical protein
MARDPVEVTELAIGYTNVGGIEVPVDLPGYFIGMMFFDVTDVVGYKHQLGCRCLFV